MGTELFLIRHGETTWNVSGKVQGCTDIPLSKNGYEQAKLASAKLKDSFDVVYCSPLIRARETANIICNGTNITPKILDEIREINFGEWEGLDFKEINKLYPNEFSLWINDKINAPLVGGEKSIKLASVRAKNCLYKTIQENENKRIAIIAHGGIIKAALIGLFNWDMTMYHKLSIGNTSISKLYIKDVNNLERIKLVYFNDTNHLNNY